MVATLGLSEALVYFSASDSGSASRYLGSTVVLSALTALPFCTGACIYMPTLLGAEPERIISAARWYLLVIPLSALGGLPAYSLRGLKQFAVWNYFRLILPMGWLLILATAYMTRRFEPGFLAGGFLTFVGLVNLVLWCFTLKFLGRPLVFCIEDWLPMLRFGLPSAITATPQMLNLKLDQFLMAALLPARLLGLYVVAVGCSGMVQPLFSAIAAVHFPNIASKPEWDSKVNSFAAVSRIGALLCVTLVLVIVPLAPTGVTLLFGSKFSQASSAVVVLVPAAAILGLNSILQEGLKGLGAPNAVMWAELGGLPITVASLALLLRPYALTGAALSSLLGYATVSILLIVQIKRLTGCSLASLFVARKHELEFLLTQITAATAIIHRWYTNAPTVRGMARGRAL
jgi:O-antigen/teichoic acid export membrane protein